MTNHRPVRVPERIERDGFAPCIERLLWSLATGWSLLTVRPTSSTTTGTYRRLRVPTAADTPDRTVVVLFGPVIAANLFERLSAGPA